MTENEQYGIIALDSMGFMYFDHLALPAIFADLLLSTNNNTVVYYKNGKYDVLYWDAGSEDFIAIDSEDIHENCRISAWEMVIVVRE